MVYLEGRIGGLVKVGSGLIFDIDQMRKTES